MATRALNVQITGDARSLNRVLDQTEKRSKRWSGTLTKGFAVAGAAAAGGLVVGLKKSAEAAIESEKSQARMITQLRASGVSYKDHAKQIDEVIQKHAKLSGLDDEDLQDSFTNIVRVTGDVDKSLRLTGLAADFARAKHIDVAKAGELVGKVAGGNTGILSRYGIQIDKGASASEALAVLQGKFAGQADAYGKTTAGALDRAGVAGENLSEIVGAKFTPLLAKGADVLVDLVDKAGKLAGPIRDASGVVGGFARRIGNAFSGGNDDATGFLDNIRRVSRRVGRLLQDVVGAVRDMVGGSSDDWVRAGKKALAFANVVSDMVDEVTKEVFPQLLEGFRRVTRGVRGMVDTTDAILKGDWKRAWREARQTVKDTVLGDTGIIGILRDGIDPASRIGRAIGRALTRGIIRGIGNLDTAIKEKLISAISKGLRAAIGGVGSLGKDLGESITKSIIPGVGDGIGRQIRGLIPSTGAGLDGADADLGPFARIGAGMGLRVSSGLRPGSVTSSGNQSFHASGDAIDMAGPPAAMMRFFRTMKRTFGSRLRELIYTPGGAGVKDGRPFTYSGDVAADHYDHVHVAYTGPFGDGLGRFNTTAYGPPWNAMNGTGVTATGVNLKPARKAYGVAVDPSVIPLGSKLKIWPNPFGYRGTFTAFDTGGAIKGRRIDFYDWRGRRAQLGWGRRAVSVQTAGGGGSGGASRPRGGGSVVARGFGAEITGSGIGAGADPFPRQGPAKGLPRSGGGSSDAGDGTDPNQPLIDAMEALRLAEEARAEAVRQHTAELAGVRGEMKRQTDLANQYAGTSEFQKTKFLADVLSGQFGRGIVGRSFTPGSAVEVAYAMSIFQIA